MRPRRMSFQYSFFWSTVWIGLAGLASCSAVDDVQGGGNPVEPQRTPTARPSASVETGPAETAPVLRMTHRGKVIVDDYPFPRPWSKNVPVQACTKDDECGDGFCDRGKCAALWTLSRYGLPCEKDGECGAFICTEGRCRSCGLHEECVKANSDPRAMCSTTTGSGTPQPVPFPGRICGILGFRSISKPPDTPTPVPTTSSQP
jgi:hypothetical protein